MKVLLTTDWYTPAVNGVVTSVLALRRQLQRQGHEVRVLTLAAGLHSHQGDGVWALGSVNAGLIYPGARLRTPDAAAALQALIAWGPDVVHSQCEFSTFALARRIARATGAPLVHTYHTVYEDYTHYFSPSRRWGRALVRGFTRHIAARCDTIVAPTAKVARLLEGYGVACPVCTLPTGIDTARFAAADPARAAALRARLGLPADRPVLLFLGRLAREKNLDELLDLMGRLTADGTPATLLVVGDGPDRPRVQALAAGLPVVFAGMADPADVPLYYAAADLFLSASTSETQGLTYLEALAAGLPAVCRADPCLDGVVENGRNGWQYRTPAELEAAVRALLADPAARRAMGQRAAAGAGTFSEEAFGRGAEALYRRLIEQTHNRAACPAERRDPLWIL